MEDAEKGEKSERQSAPFQSDPRHFQEALRSLFQPIKTDDPRADFYAVYKKEATEYDAEYVKKFDEDLNTVSIFAGLLSAVSSTFVTNVQPKLQPDPNEQSAALLRAILLTLNQSAIPGETPTVPPAQEDPPSEIVTATCLMYASFLISLLAAFVAMLAKQWINRYLRTSRGSMIERCRDRQRKFDGIEKWSLHLFVTNLLSTLQVSLLLLVYGLCQYMWSINTPVASVLIGFAISGVGFYVATVIAGTLSYASPFQTPVSTLLRIYQKIIRRKILSTIIYYKRVFSRTRKTRNRGVRSPRRRQSLPMTTPLKTIQVYQSEPWLKPEVLDIIRRTNINDLQCVSWIIRYITDPEALDAAIRLAGTIRWFDDGINISPPYDLIVSVFEACFDSTRTLYPESRDRAYYSGQAIVWIHTLAMRKSEELARSFPLPSAKYTTRARDPDLEHLLQANRMVWNANYCIEWLLRINPDHTPSHSRRVSNLLLHYSWTNQTKLDHGHILDCVSATHETETTIPLNAILNRLLVWCIFLGLHVEKEVLEIQDKFDHMEPILDRLSRAVLLAINDTSTQRGFILPILCDLVKLENHPKLLTEIAYEWCSAICENRRSLQDWESLVFTSLEIGFRHLDFQDPSIEIGLTHTEHHWELVDVVFRSQRSEVIADLLQAWTAESKLSKSAHALLSFCVGHFAGLQNLMPFPPRLRRLVIRSIELAGYKRFEGVEVERFIGLLNHLDVTVEDMDNWYKWGELLLETIQTSEGAQRLSHWCWELLVEVAIPFSRLLRDEFAYDSQITTFLIEAQEWRKLEYWMATVWMIWPPGAGGITEEDLDHLMLLLFRQQPGAVQKLERWMARWSQTNRKDIPGSFQRIYIQAQEAAQHDVPAISSTDSGTEEPAFPPRPRVTGSGSRYRTMFYNV